MTNQFYKMLPDQWDEGTDELKLEQEGAFLRVCLAKSDATVSEWTGTSWGY